MIFLDKSDWKQSGSSASLFLDLFFLFSVFVCERCLFKYYNNSADTNGASWVMDFNLKSSRFGTHGSGIPHFIYILRRRRLIPPDQFYQKPTMIKATLLRKWVQPNDS